jgi:hypothetical protein
LTPDLARVGEHGRLTGDGEQDDTDAFSAEEAEGAARSRATIRAAAPEAGCRPANAQRVARVVGPTAG